ncbi:MAG: DegV family protein [Desulforudis sp.]|jgi:DegV family protein with EDD domain|nr:MAG: DegV family protein [Desulforudis sp.]
MTVRIVTDSTSYIPYDLREELGIAVVSLSVSFETETFREEEIDNATFYQKMAASKRVPTSSQPTPYDFYSLFEESVRAGDPVVGIFISADMSGTCQSALTARKMVLEKYPEAVIEIVDSRSNCMELGFAVLAAARAAKASQPLEEVVRQARHVIERSRFLFVPETLEYLRKGGRIGGAAALLGAILQIRPILTVMDGKTEVFNKVRTKGRAIQAIVETFLMDVQQRGLGEVAVHHINSEAEGKKVAEMIKERLGKTVPVYSIGPVIGLHVGPGTVGVVYYTREMC